MEAAVEQCSVDRKCSQLHEKDTVISKLNETIHSLRDNANPAKVKNDIDETETINIELEHISKPNATTIAPGMYKLDIEPISHRLKNNSDAHADYLKKTIENTNTIRGLVERARKQNPSEPLLDSTCVFTKHVQELLVYVSKTCPSFTKPSEKLVVVTPLNKDKKVRFADPVISSSNTQSQVNSYKTKDFNQTLLHSTGVICTSDTSGSKPTRNTKNNRISQPSSSNKTNKSMLNANSKSLCVICNECLFDANYNKCVLDYVHDVNVLSKSKYAKHKNKEQIWKPTGKVYTEIGYKSKHTGRTFTIVRNKCPLTRFTSTKVAPLKETTIKSVLTPTQGIKVYSRRPKATKSVGLSSKSKITESRISNNLEPTQVGESNVPSSSLIHCRVYYVEGPGHNLLSVGQFCDSNLEVAFHKHTCCVRNLEGVDLLTGSRGTNLYTLSIGYMMKSSPICLLSKASKTKSWLWHRRLSHLNFGTINQLAKQGLVVQIVLWYLDFGCSKHITRNRSQLTNFFNKFLGTVKFSNDQIAKIMGFGDYKIENFTISRVYYVEGLGHNLFSVGQFCDSNLEVAFHKHTCCVRNLEGVDLLTGSRGTNLYTLSIGDMMKSSPICLLSKASKTKSWLWHRRLSHLNFGTINQLAKQGLVRGLPKLKFEKDHLCSACSLGKNKKQSHKPKSEDTNQEKLYLLHMDLCGPIRVESINGKKYILVIVDDYSRFTWVKFLRSKDEAPEFIIKFLKMIQVCLNASVMNIRTDNGTEFVNQTLRSYYEDVGISHETSVARTPQQDGVVERRNQTLVEATRTMLIYAKAPLFPWEEAVATACYTQNRSFIRLRHKKTPYELLDDRKPDLSYLHVFDALCYPTNDSEDLGKLKAKADVDFDELTAMASEQSSSGPALNEMTPGTLSSGLVSKHPSSTPFVPTTRNYWDTLLQPLFDEYFRPPPNVDHPVLEALAPVPSVSTDSPSSTLVD
ncbi:retrovirus-related pol polyprotein from transposon TNT 1-94 [Tanacetum coccineum]